MELDILSLFNNCVNCGFKEIKNTFLWSCVIDWFIIKKNILHTKYFCRENENMYLRKNQ